jgi:hypothetical protein
MLTEYELVNNQGGSEVKVTAKEGKVQINKQGNTYEVDFKPAKVLFTNDPFARILRRSFAGSSTLLQIKRNFV